ncbi:hypothetical protein HYV69_02505 [Candidatus Uhrbacteria bacterium]|nr:hypothetical protein [Candidatus Uhrbacteria bacterium]
MFIVGGTWGQVPLKDTKEWCELIAFKARDARCEYGDRELIASSVKIIDDLNDGDLRSYLMSMNNKVVVFFNSRGNLSAARTFKKSCPSASVYVMTALIPTDEVTILNKDILIDVPSLGPFLR